VGCGRNGAPETGAFGYLPGGSEDNKAVKGGGGLELLVRGNRKARLRRRKTASEKTTVVTGWLGENAGGW